MASLETLPSDQRAVLELVLRRGRSYDQIAEMLGIDRAGVRARALAALDAVGPQTPVSNERRHLITDYLLGALNQRVAAEVRSLLAGSPPERAWARVVASELEPIASEPLPEIPVDGAARPRAPVVEPRPTEAKPRPAEAKPRPTEAEPAAPARPARRVPPSVPPVRPSSRVGGAVLLGLGSLLVVAGVVVLIIVLTGGSKSKPTSRLARRPPSTSKQAKAPTTGAQVLSQINLNPPNGGAAKGVAVVLRVGGHVGIEIRAAGLAPNSQRPPNAYAVWLYNSHTDSHILGFVNPGVGKNGQLQTAGGLPSNAARFQKLLITLETQSSPRTPGTIVLQGALSGLS